MPQNHREVDAYVAQAIENVKTQFLIPATQDESPFVAKYQETRNTVTVNDEQTWRGTIATYAFRDLFLAIPSGTKKNPKENTRNVMFPILVIDRNFLTSELNAMNLQEQVIRYGRHPRHNDRLRELLDTSAHLPFVGTGPVMLHVRNPVSIAVGKAQQIYAQRVVSAAADEVGVAYGYRASNHDEKFHKSLKTKLMRALLAHMNRNPGQAGAYQDFVRFVGRQPDALDLNVFLVMRNVLNQMRDTPSVAGLVFDLLKDRIAAAQKDSTFTEHMRYAGKVDPKRAMAMVKKFVDPKSVWLPRHWRAFTKEHPNGFTRAFYRNNYGYRGIHMDTRELGALVYRITSDFWPRKAWPKEYRHVLEPGKITGIDEIIRTAPLVSEYGGEEWPDIVKTYLEAVWKYSQNERKQNRHMPYHQTAERIRLLKALIENQANIKMDGDMKRASLKRLYELAQKNEWVSNEPEGSLRFGRFRVDEFPSGDEPLERGDVKLVPLRTHVDLFHEGNEMGHCLYTSWTNDVKAGKMFPYKVLRNNAHVGTAVIWKDQRGKRIHQIVGQHNRGLPIAIDTIARDLLQEVCEK